MDCRQRYQRGFWGSYLHRVASEAARVACFPEALLAGRNEAGRDGIAHNLFLKDKLLGRVLRQGLHVADHPAILALSACIPNRVGLNKGIDMSLVLRKTAPAGLKVAPEAERGATPRIEATQRDVGRAVTLFAHLIASCAGSQR